MLFSCKVKIYLIFYLISNEDVDIVPENGIT